jgi:cell division transport system permease protein
MTKPAPTPRSMLPLRSKQDGPLFFVIAIIVFLACVSALITRAAFVSAQHWRADLNGAMTVQIKDATDQAIKVRRAQEVLGALKGIRTVTVYDRAYAVNLLEPWLGKGNIPDDLPLPVILAIDLDPQAPASKNAISLALSAADIRAEVDDHQRWSGQMNRAAGFVQSFAIVALALLISAGIAVTGFATRASLAARRDVVNTLHLAGAYDRFIAQEFERRFGALGLRAGLTGAVLGGAAIAMAQWLTSGGEGLLIPVFRLDLTGLGILVLAPVLTAFFGALTARMTVLSNLREQE